MAMATLYFLHLPGCEHCDAAMPALDAFAAKRFDIDVVKVDLTISDASELFDRITNGDQVTPTYVLHQPGRAVDVRLGGIEDLDALEAWVEEKTS